MRRPLFFDSPRVLRAVDAGTARVLAKVGAFIRRRAKSLLRYRKGASGPGGPPHVHRGSFSKKTVNKKTGAVSYRWASPLRELIFFGYDPARKSVVAGPLKFGKNPAADIIEYGGVSTDGKYHAARPTMRPALAEAVPKAAPMFKNMIR